MTFDEIESNADFLAFLADHRLALPQTLKFRSNTARILNTVTNSYNVLMTFHDEISARDGQPFVRVYWFNSGDEAYFVPKGKRKELTAEEKRQYAIKQQKREQAQQELRLKSMQRAYHEYLSASVPCKHHAYPTLKGVKVHHGVRYATQTLTETDAAGKLIYRLGKGDMLIPIISLDKKFMSYQRIRKNGTKLLCADGVKSGGFYPIGAWNSTMRQVILAEGYATGATLYESTGITVMVCFDVGNVTTLAKMLKEKFPELDVIIATDFDLEKNQAGLLTALRINQELGYKVVFPIAVVDGSDWNDLQHESDQDFVHSHFFEQLADIEKRSADEVAKDYYSFLNETNLEKLAA